jgi:hypothetical protein
MQFRKGPIGQMTERRLPPFPILKTSLSTALAQICDASTLTTMTLQSAVDSPTASDSLKSPSILEGQNMFELFRVLRKSGRQL